MKILFIEARKKIQKSNINFKNLPDKVHILYIIQYKELAERIKKQLGKKVLAFTQVLGCSKIKPKASLLLIGSGRFHALNIAFSTEKPVYMYNTGNIEKIGAKEIKEFKAGQKAKFIKFLASEKIGILISNKPGQNKIKEASKLKEKLEKKYSGKKFCLFLADNINMQELENFPADFFINTACPGLSLDSSKMINMDKIL